MNDTPLLPEVEDCWSKIWEDEDGHNEGAEWIKEQEEKQKYQQCQKMRDITISDVRMAISNTNNWTSPGLDKIPTFWLKNLEELHMDMARNILSYSKNQTSAQSG